MGKQGSQKAWQKGQGGKWDYWSGAWANSWQQGNSQANSVKDDAGKFPNYQDVTIQKSEAEPHAASAKGELDSNAMPTAAPNFVRDMQKALNSSRKLDAKIRKLAEEKALRQAQWQEYQQQMKTKFVAQHQAFQTDMEKLEEDLAYAKKQKEQATITIASIAEGKENMAAVETVPEREATAAELAAWHSLMDQGNMEVEDVCRQQVAGSAPDVEIHKMLMEWKEAADTRDEFFRSQMRAFQNELRELRPKPGSAGAAGDGGGVPLVTPTRRTSHGLQMTPTPPSQPAIRSGPPVATRTATATGAGMDAMASLEAGPAGYVETQAVMKDPYMCSPSGSIHQGLEATPPPQVSAFGPIRSVKRVATQQPFEKKRGSSAKAVRAQPEACKMDGKEAEDASSALRLIDDDNEGPSNAAVVELD